MIFKRVIVFGIINEKFEKYRELYRMRLGMGRVRFIY